MKKTVAALAVVSMLALISVPAFAEGTVQTSTADVTKTLASSHKFAKRLVAKKNVVNQVEKFKSAIEKIQNLEKNILELKHKENKLKGLSEEESKAALNLIRNEFKVLKTARELSQPEKDQIKELCKQIQQIRKSDITNEQKVAAIEPLRNKISAILEPKKTIIKSQITKLENDLKALKDSVNVKKSTVPNTNVQ